MDTTPAPASSTLRRAPEPDETLAERRARVGRRGEDLAAASLAIDGLTIVDRNWRLRTGEVRGELDLVCIEGDTLVIVEVKTRRSGRFGGPLLAVTADKQDKIRALTAAWLRDHRPRTSRVRFDVVGVVLRHETDGGPVIEHVRAAF